MRARRSEKRFNVLVVVAVKALVNEFIPERVVVLLCHKLNGLKVKWHGMEMYGFGVDAAPEMTGPYDTKMAVHYKDNSQNPPHDKRTSSTSPSLEIISLIASFTLPPCCRQ